MIVMLAACGPAVNQEHTEADGSLGSGSGAALSTYQHYSGHLATTETIPFGGDPYCMYSVTLKDVVVDVTFRDVMQLVTATVEDTMTEGIIGTCPYPPAMPNRQVFEHRSGPWVANPDGFYRPMLVGLPANRPATAITAEVSTPDAKVSLARLRWARTDQDGTLNWLVTGSVTAEPVSCTPGALICVGGTEGILFGCLEDGASLQLNKQCSAGCSASKDACN